MLRRLIIVQTADHVKVPHTDRFTDFGKLDFPMMARF